MTDKPETCLGAVTLVDTRTGLAQAHKAERHRPSPPGLPPSNLSPGLTPQLCPKAPGRSTPLGVNRGLHGNPGSSSVPSGTTETGHLERARLTPGHLMNHSFTHLFNIY